MEVPMEAVMLLFPSLIYLNSDLPKDSDNISGNKLRHAIHGFVPLCFD